MNVLRINTNVQKEALNFIIISVMRILVPKILLKNIMMEYVHAIFIILIILIF